MIAPPCKGCPDRKLNCHSECEKYLAFRKERDELLIRKKKYLNNIYKSKNADRIKRKNLMEGRTGRRR